jgi:DNA-binding transcriptional LysR family regulator
MHLHEIDLNLLVVLDMLLQEQNVTRAAERLGLTQSATSHALARLRALFEDPLLLRERGQMLLSERAESLKPMLAEAIRLMRCALIAPAPFEPKTATRAFSIGAGDYAQFVLLPPLMKLLAREAPGLDIWAKEPISGDLHQRLASGDMDLAVIAQFSNTDEKLRSRVLFDEHFVCLLRKDHPQVKKTLSLEQFVTLPHAFIAPRGTRGGVVDDALKSINKERRVALAVPHFLVAPYMIAESDLIITLASRIAKSFASHLPLKILPPPIELPSFQMVLVWHERSHRDPAHKWLREKIVESTKLNNKR